MAIPSYSPAIAGKIETFVWQFGGQYTATVAEIMRFPAPFGGTLKYLSATAQASGGTTPTATFEMFTGTTSLLDSAVSVTAGADAEATLTTDPAFAEGDVMTLDLTIGGGSPTWDNLTVTCVLERD